MCAQETSGDLDAADQYLAGLMALSSAERTQQLGRLQPPPWSKSDDELLASNDADVVERLTRRFGADLEPVKERMVFFDERTESQA